MLETLLLGHVVGVALAGPSKLSLLSVASWGIAAGTPGRWAVSRETIPRLLEINQPPSPLSPLVLPGGLHFPQRKVPFVDFL